MFEAVAIVVGAMKNDATLTAIVDAAQIFEDRHPGQNTVFPYIVVSSETVDFCNDADLQILDLNVFIMSNQNTSAELISICKAVMNLINKTAIQSATAKVLIHFAEEMAVDNSQLNIDPKPRARNLQFFLIEE